MTRARAMVPLLASALLLAVTAEGSDDRGRPTNIVLFLVDDMGWSDLGCTGSDLFRTPNIDRLAAQGLRFTDAESACTVCSPTRAAIMTGKAPARLRITDWIHGHERPKARLRVPEWTQYLPFEEATIAARLKPAGYVSASIGKWHLGDGPAHYPTRHGFDRNVAGFGAGSPPRYFAPYRIPTLKDGLAGEYLTDRLATEACAFLDANRDRPFFLYLPHYAVHTPLQAKPKLVDESRARVGPGTRHRNATYAAMIASLDDAVGRVLEKLDALKLADRTLVVFTSDNGGLIGSTANDPLRAGKGSAYEGGVRIPLLVRWPGIVAPGGVCREPVISMDLFPTFLEAAGAATRAEAEAKTDGKSLIPLLEDPKSRLDRDAIFWHYPHYHPGGATPYSAIRARDWRLVEFFEDNHAELYNLADDPSEAHDLARARPEKADEMRRTLRDWRASVGAQLPTPNPDFDPTAPDARPR